MFQNATPAGHRSLLSAIVSRAIGARWHRKNSGISAPAPIMLTTQNGGGAGQTRPSVNWEARAQRQCNRSAKLAPIYVRKHIILEAGRG